MELAAIEEWGKPFVTATYSLEGDGPLVMEAYEKIETVRAAIRAGRTPKLMSMLLLGDCVVATIRVWCKEFLSIALKRVRRYFTAVYHSLCNSMCGTWTQLL